MIERPICLMTSVKDKNRYKNNKIFDYIISQRNRYVDQNKHNSLCKT